MVSSHGYFETTSFKRDTEHIWRKLVSIAEAIDVVCSTLSY